MNILNPPYINARVTYTPIVPAAFAKASSGNAWVDTDVSATTGTDTKKIWHINTLCSNATSQAGARTHGTSGNLQFSATTAGNVIVPLFTSVDTNGHMDLFDPANPSSQYWFMGYYSLVTS